MKILFASLLLFLSSCSTYRRAVEAVNQNIDYVSPAVAITAGAVLDRAVSPEDRADKATVLKKLADQIEALEITGKPTREEFTELLSGALPAKLHWQALISNLANFYEKSTAKIENGDVDGTLKIVKKIALGLSIAATKYE